MDTSRGQVRPAARHEDLLAVKCSNETLAYDLTTFYAHRLTPLADHVWEHCDGRHTVAHLTRLAEQDLTEQDLAAQHVTKPVQEAEVWQALAELSEANLLQEPVVAPAAVALSRRQLLAAAAGMAVTALVQTIVVPTAADASSTLPPGHRAMSSAQCKSGLSSGGVCQ